MSLLFTCTPNSAQSWLVKCECHTNLFHQLSCSFFSFSVLLAWDASAGCLEAFPLCVCSCLLPAAFTAPGLLPASRGLSLALPLITQPKGTLPFFGSSRGFAAALFMPFNWCSVFFMCCFDFRPRGCKQRLCVSLWVAQHKCNQKAYLCFLPELRWPEWTLTGPQDVQHNPLSPCSQPSMPEHQLHQLKEAYKLHSRPWVDSSEEAANSAKPLHCPCQSFEAVTIHRDACPRDMPGTELISAAAAPTAGQTSAFHSLREVAWT